MMGNLLDLTGKRFGKLLVLFRAGSTRHKKATWWCLCICGCLTETVGSELVAGYAQSCGCQRGTKGYVTIGKIKRVCMSCGTSFEMYKSTLKTGRTGDYCSNKCFGLSHRGTNHPRWNPDKTEEEAIRQSRGYFDWRSAVFKRDSYTCLKCGAKGGVLNAHHIRPFHKYKKLRLSVSNGGTLCRECHIKFHSDHGKLNCSMNDFNKFLLKEESK